MYLLTYLLTVSLLSGLVEDMELDSDMKLRLNEAAQLLAPKQLVTEVMRRSCEATTSGYFGIKRTDKVKCPYCPISLVLENTEANCQRDLEIRLSSDTSNALVFGREVRALVDTEYELVNNERTQTYKVYVEGVRKRSKHYYAVCAETNTCLVCDYLWTTPKSSTKEVNAVTYERQLIAEAEDAVAEK